MNCATKTTQKYLLVGFQNDKDTLKSNLHSNDSKKMKLFFRLDIISLQASHVQYVCMEDVTGLML